MKARLFYFTSPEPGIYVINIQPEGSDELMRFEVTPQHLAHVTADGAEFAARESRVLATLRDTQAVA